MWNNTQLYTILWNYSHDNQRCLPVWTNLAFMNGWCIENGIETNYLCIQCVGSTQWMCRVPSVTQQLTKLCYCMSDSVDFIYGEGLMTSRRCLFTCLSTSRSQPQGLWNLALALLRLFSSPGEVVSQAWIYQMPKVKFNTLCFFCNCFHSWFKSIKSLKTLCWRELFKLSVTWLWRDVASAHTSVKLVLQ